MSEVLIATLGTEAQVVTLSLLELERLNFEVNEVVVVRTSGATPTIQESLARLDEAFGTDERLRHYLYRHELLQGKHGPIADITTETEAEDTFNSLFQVVKRYKLNGSHIHLNVAGGRKPMSIYGMVTAQILFDDEDHLWHLVSNDELVNSRRLFPEPGDEYSLVPIPVIRSTDFSAHETGIIRAETAQEAIRTQERLRQAMRYERFLNSDLTKSEKAIIHLIAQGLNNKEIVAQRGVKPNTVEKQINQIYGKWRAFKGLDDDVQPRGQIVAELSAYFIHKEKDLWK